MLGCTEGILGLSLGESQNGNSAGVLGALLHIRRALELFEKRDPLGGLIHRMPWVAGLARGRHAGDGFGRELLRRLGRFSELVLVVTS